MFALYDEKRLFYSEYLIHFVVKSMFQHIQSVVATTSEVVERNSTSRSVELYLHTTSPHENQEF